MKTYSKALLCAVLFSAAAVQANAQTVNDFFLDNYAFKYRYNPAMPSEKSFFSIGAGAVDAGLDANVGLSSFLFPTESGSLVTGLHSSVSAGEFLGGLPDIAGINFDVNENLLSIGSWSSRGFTSFEANIRAGVDMNLPKGFFEFAKLGSENKTFNLNDLAASGNVYLELAFGRTLALSDALALGFRLKGLLGIASAGANAQKFNLTATKTTLAAEADAQMQIALKGATLSTDEDGHFTPDSEFDFSGDDMGLAGFGAAIDLGATYIMGPLTFSAAILDLGFMKWNYNIVGGSNGSYTFEGFEDIDVTDPDADFEETLEGVVDDLASVLDFSPRDAFSKTSKLHMAANAGVRYSPFNLLSVGATAYMKKGISGTFIDARAGATINPLPCISLSGSIGRNSYGGVCGAAASINLAFLNVYASVDSYLGNVMPTYYIPVDPFRMNAKLGLVMVFGKRHTERK